MVNAISRPKTDFNVSFQFGYTKVPTTWRSTTLNPTCREINLYVGTRKCWTSPTETDPVHFGVCTLEHNISKFHNLHTYCRYTSQFIHYQRCVFRSSYLEIALHYNPENDSLTLLLWSVHFLSRWVRSVPLCKRQQKAFLTNRARLQQNNDQAGSLCVWADTSCSVLSDGAVQWDSQLPR